jgi:type IV pilus assembly protein PilE
MNTANRNSGFTLIELMITVAIVAILAAIALPSYSNYIEKSKMRTAQSDLVAVAAALDNFRQRTLAYPNETGDKGAYWLSQTLPTWSAASDANDYEIKVNFFTNGQIRLRATGSGGCILTFWLLTGVKTAASCPSSGTNWL